MGTQKRGIPDTLWWDIPFWVPGETKLVDLETRVIHTKFKTDINTAKALFADNPHLLGSQVLKKAALSPFHYLL